MSELTPNEPAHADNTRLQREETLLASRLDLSASQLMNSMGPDAAPFVQRAIEWEFADVADQSSLDTRAQEIVAITTLATLGQTAAPVLAMRIQSALRAGLSRREIVDVFAQMALGTGLPVALAATKVAAEVFSRTPDQQCIARTPKATEHRTFASSVCEGSTGRPPNRNSLSGLGGDFPRRGA